MYFSRQGVSDINWILKKMRAIPEDRRREVTNHYEQLLKFNDGCSGRREANEYLDAVASEYRPAREVAASKTAKRLLTPIKSRPKKEREYKSDDRLWSKKI
jgi:hypothetical protein